MRSPILRAAADAAIERLKAAGRAYVKYAVEHPELLRAMFDANGLATLELSPLSQEGQRALAGVELLQRILGNDTTNAPPGEPSPS